jgi:CRP/FNR family transcriptional regulator, cyclic AMP receptor protein
MGGEIADRLREHPFSGGFCPEHIAHLAAMATEIQFPAGETVFHEGDQSSRFYLLVSGSVGLEVRSPDGPMRVARLFAGEVLGWSAVTGGTGQQFQARALEDTRALAFDGARLRHDCEADYSFGFRFARAVLNAMAGRLHAIRARLPDICAPVRDEP